MRSLARPLIGLALGFVATYATVEAIDRFAYDSSNDAPTEHVLGAPDFGSFCQERERVALNSTGDANGWRCAGTTNGLWSADEFDYDDVCREQFGTGSSANLLDGSVDGWLCVAEP